MKKELNQLFNQSDNKDLLPSADLKEAVFSSLDRMQMASDIFDLFTFKFASTETQFLDGVNKKDENKSDQK